MQYLALLRGINVGGNAKIKMADLKVVLEQAGLNTVTTYIQSGNVIFSSEIKDANKLGDIINNAINKSLALDIAVVVLTKPEWATIITLAPTWWGKNPEWKHNLLVLLKPYDMHETMLAIGTLKPDIEAAEPGKGVVYQSMSKEFFGRTTTGKLASSPIYKKMTIRNYNTATKLLELLDKI